MKKLTFLLTDPTPVRGPYTLAQLRVMWTAREINEDSRIFVTENDQQTHQVQLRFIHARDIADSLENGTEIDVSRLPNNE